MFSKQITKRLQVSLLALTIAAPLATPALADSGLVGDAAAQLAAAGTGFQATTAAIDVAPAKMAGECPEAFAFNVRLGARAPGKLSYRIVTEDGRESQVFEAYAQRTNEGLFIAQANHQLALADDAETGPSHVVFNVPEHVKQLREPDFFERLFGTGPASEQNQADALRNLSFAVKVVAPNEVASGYDSYSATCEELREARIFPVSEDQSDSGDRDRGGRDDSSDRGDGGRGDRGRGGGTDAAGGAID
jgi:hypothetical protein